MAAALGRVLSVEASSSSAALLFFNLVDALFTIFYLQLGVAEEANPLMALAYRGSPLTFVVVKLFAVYIGVLLLTRYERFAQARWAMDGGALMYAAIAGYHLSFLAHVSGLR